MEMIQHQHSASGATLYALVRNSAAEVWNGVAFVPYLTANLGTYALPMTEQGTASACYTVAFPIVAVGLYVSDVFVQTGGAPAEGNTPVKTQTHEWSSSALGLALLLDDTNSVVSVTNSRIGVPSISLAVELAAKPTASEMPAAVWGSAHADQPDPGTFGGLVQGLSTILVPVNVTQISGSTLAADKLEAHAGAVNMIVIGNGSTTTSIVLNTVDGAAPPAGPDVFNRRVLVITSGALNRQACGVLDYDGSTGTLTLEALGFTGAAANGTIGVIV